MSQKGGRLWICCAIFLTLWAGLASGCRENGPVIRLAANPWLSSELNAQVAGIILREELGFQVEIVAVDEDAQWPALVRGDLDACLEVWPSGHQKELDAYLGRDKSLQSLGLLGVVGKIGWYVPSYVLAEHPQLADWRGFKEPGLAALFRTPASGSQGQFLAGDPSWVQYDGQIIANLGLPLTVVWAGSEEAILKALDGAVRDRRPILFYFWFPHLAHVKYRLSEVKLPVYTDACYAKARQNGVDCSYPPDILMKIAWPGLKDKAPLAYRFLRNFNLGAQDQLAMLTLITQGQDPAQAARTWLERNRTKWREWLPIPG